MIRFQRLRVFLKKEDSLVKSLIVKWFFLSALFLFIAMISYTRFHRAVIGLQQDQENSRRLQKRWTKLKETEVLFNQDASTLEQLKKRNFYKEWTEAQLAEFWEGVLQTIPKSLNDYTLMELSKTTEYVGNHYNKGIYRHVSSLKTEGYFWHENNWIAWMRHLNTLSGWVREKECTLHLPAAESFYPKKESMATQYPPLEGSCVLELHWVQ